MTAKNKNDLIAAAAIALADNNTGDIEPSDHRTVYNDQVDSALNIVEASTQTVAGSVDFTGGLQSGGDELVANAGLDKQIFVSDGAGGGTWEYEPQGWGFYQDNAAAQTFTTTPAKLSINNLGASANSDYLPREIRGVSELWDAVENKITPIAMGDGYQLVILLPVTAKTGSPTDITVSLDVGGASTITALVYETYETTGKTPPYGISVVIPFVALVTAGITNGVQIFINTDSGTVDITAPSVIIKRDMADR